MLLKLVILLESIYELMKSYFEIYLEQDCLFSITARYSDIVLFRYDLNVMIPLVS